MEALISQWQKEQGNDQTMSNHMFQIMENLEHELSSHQPHESYNNFPFQLSSSMEEPLMVESTWKVSAGKSNISSSSSSSSPCLISFGQRPDHELSEGHENLALKKPSVCNHEHVVAERRRRERINQLFIQLSAIIPGLKKTAKTSLLEEALNYVKQLEARLRILEHKTLNVGSVSKSHSCTDQEQLLVINGRAIDKKICLKIHCKTLKNVVVKFLSEIENLHVSITNANLITLSADSSLDITVIAQAEEGFSMTIEELVEKLNSTFRQLI